ncbi:MAG: hypothetical protein KJO91_13410 [Gammaproteobacteria bacterium]|nr:hypothetical protein [Gammaproteobacteria bacterium]
MAIRKSFIVQKNEIKSISGQKGIVVLIFAIILSMTVIAYFLSGLSPQELTHNQIVSTSKSLSRAKQALLAYAASRADIATPTAQPGRLGYLPCPANNNGEGNSVGTCGASNMAAIGWFPWRSLGLPPLKDESGTCLLYAVSGSYKFSPPPNMLNEDSYGMFQIVDESENIVQGSSPENRVVALVFAAGKALPGQARNYKAGTQCGDDVDNFGAYLDEFKSINNSSVNTAKVDEIDQFIHATAESMAHDAETPRNDRFITITRDEIWSAIMLRDEFDASLTTGTSKTRRVTEALARCLAQYGNGNANSRLPFPAPMDLDGNDYRDRDSYDDASVATGQHFGRFPYIVDSSDSVIPGTSAVTELFDKDFAAPPQNPPAGNIVDCNSLPIAFPLNPVSNLRTSTSEDRIYWENRKDHFFYAVSSDYRPNAGPADDTAGAPRCAGGCLTVAGIQHAAVVIYSGEKQGGQRRHAPVAPSDTEETKNDFTRYVEVVNAAGTGTGDYTPTGNDVIFCITDTDPLSVVPCP